MTTKRKTPLWLWLLAFVAAVAVGWVLLEQIRAYTRTQVAEQNAAQDAEIEQMIRTDIEGR